MAGVGARTTGRGYLAGGSGGLTFTGHERDIDTGLDYFGARFHHSVPGRFTSVDPAEGSLSLGNPQSFNRYSYVLNSPMILIDPDGRWPTRANTHTEQGMWNLLVNALPEDNDWKKISSAAEELRDQHVYTQEEGFVDLLHVVTAAATILESMRYTDAIPAGVAMVGGAGGREIGSMVQKGLTLVGGTIGIEIAEGLQAVAGAILLAGGTAMKATGYGGPVEGSIWINNAIGTYNSASAPYGPNISPIDRKGFQLGLYFATFVYDRKGRDSFVVQLANWLTSMGIVDPRALPSSSFGRYADFMEKMSVQDHRRNASKALILKVPSSSRTVR